MPHNLMASFVGHSLAALATGRGVATKKERALLFSWPVTLALVVLANIPDLDVVIWILFKPAGMTPHRGASHSLIFAVGLALVAWLIVSRAGKRGGFVLPIAFVLAAMTHPVLDYFMAGGPRVPFWWPFSKTGYLSHIQLIPTVYYSKVFYKLIALLADPRNDLGMVLETFTFLPILLAQKYAGRSFFRWLPFLALSAASVCLTYFIYKGPA